jgi:aspartate/methionine/tyrosine aminotransferase
VLTNPHNPTGKILIEDDIKQLSDILYNYPDVTILSDDVYFHLPYDGTKYKPFANYANNWEKQSLFTALESC